MANRTQISRRTFLDHCAAIAAATGLPAGSSSASCRRPDKTPAPETSPNDRPGIALIGCGGMGRGDLKSASRFGNVVALCDVDIRHAAAVGPAVHRQRRTPPEQVTDFRRVLDRKDVHVIIKARRITGTR